MSTGLKRLFGAGKKEVTHESANEVLSLAEERLKKKQAYLEKQIQLEVANARKFGIKNKRSALECLRKSKLYEKQLEQNDGALMRLQAQRNALDSALMNKNMLDTMRTANQAMKTIHKGMDVDKVQDMMDDINEQQDIANEIANAISSPIGANQFDEDELLQELQKFEENFVEEQLLDVGGMDSLPSVPAGEPVHSKPIKKSTPRAEDELANLADWAT